MSHARVLTTKTVTKNSDLKTNNDTEANTTSDVEKFKNRRKQNFYLLSLCSISLLVKVRFELSGKIFTKTLRRLWVFLRICVDFAIFRSKARQLSYRFYKFVTTRYTTDFYIRNWLLGWLLACLLTWRLIDWLIHRSVARHGTRIPIDNVKKIICQPL